MNVRSRPSQGRATLVTMRLLPLATLAAASTLWVACSSDDSAGIPADVDAGSIPAADASTPLDASADAPPSDAAGEAEAGGGTPIGPGPYSIVYSAANGIGIDQRPTVTTVVGASGELESYEASEQEKPSRGTNTVAELHSDALSLLGRWNGGTTAGTFYTSGPFTYSATQGFHYGVVIKPASALPQTGTVAYTQLKTTAATMEDGSAALGTITAKAAVLVTAAGKKTGIELTVAVPGDATYTASTTGGVADPSQSTLGGGTTNNAVFGEIPVTGAGAACPAGCNVAFRGLIGGGPSGTSRFALAFVVTGAGAAKKSVRGVIMFAAP